MNLNDPKHPWQRLTAAARTIRDDRETAAPHGFATRVAALAFAAPPSSFAFAERFALRALGVAGLLAILSVAINYSALQRVSAAPVQQEELTDDDPVSVLLGVEKVE